MEIPAVISSLVCVSSSSVNYNFFRLNRTNLVARRFCRSVVLDLDTRTWIATSLRFDTYIYTYTFKEKENQIVMPDAYTHTFLHFVSDEFVWNSRD